jgi:hypothetical protein
MDTIILQEQTQVTSMKPFEISKGSGGRYEQYGLIWSIQASK